MDTLMWLSMYSMDEVIAWTYPNLINGDLGRLPMDQILVCVYSIDHDRPSTTNIVNRFIGEDRRTCCFDLQRAEHISVWKYSINLKALKMKDTYNRIESIRIILLKLLPLGLRILPIQLDILVRSTEFLRSLCFDPFVGC
jgi:hypothetical protein